MAKGKGRTQKTIASGKDVKKKKTLVEKLIIFYINLLGGHNGLIGRAHLKVDDFHPFLN